MEQKNLEQLIARYRAGRCNAEERATVEDWYLQHAKKQRDELPEYNYETVEAEIWSRIQAKNRRPGRSTAWYKWAVAAMVVVVAGLGVYRFDIGQDRLRAPGDVMPGKTRAELVLANGDRIELDAAQDGRHTDDLKPGDAVQGYRTIATPRGGQYHFQLPDGSRVWLNAYSSLTFPARFTGKERKVLLKGEAYFEIAHNKLKPFRVRTASQEIEVLGTRFNVSSYRDEGTSKVTLLQGSIKVSEYHSRQIRLLSPGQELAASPGGTVIKEVNAREAIDWKLGYFSFHDEDIRSVMQKVSRWYDVDVVYRGPVPDGGLEGTISRSQNLSKVLEMLQATGLVHLEFSAGKIIVRAANP
ncbi:hypothetical protein C7T94_08620 [Pedobacter yulinensis]|uniref:Anti-sigma factor n=1 Tax=Pedobacter yulinensis TaxID=2126353 RepID=A0A2T3HJX7_9SPHI|nr:FecR family protein [Pedobacter yulinensis]PST82709.1 hypothetical protein C7T94_08620 [Pedobacter yulinensis]